MYPKNNIVLAFQELVCEVLNILVLLGREKKNMMKEGF
jgi:hypothetical protein